MTTSAELESACLVAEAVASLIDAMGMHALNQKRLADGHSIAYDDESFHKVSGSLEKSIAELKANHPLVFGAPTETPVETKSPEGEVPEAPKVCAACHGTGYIEVWQHPPGGKPSGTKAPCSHCPNPEKPKEDAEWVNPMTILRSPKASR